MQHSQGIDAVFSALGETPGKAGSVRSSRAPSDQFESHFAAFYPYAQPPVDPQPRAGSATDARQRGNAIGALSASQRRQSRRGDT